MLTDDKAVPADQVILHHTPAYWFAEFRGPIAREMAAISGADTVPTGFNGHIPAAVVCSAIALLNPNAQVQVAKEGEAAAQAAKPHVSVITEPAPQPTTAAARTGGAALRLAAEVVGKHEDAARSAAIERAMKLKRSLGLMVACSYLRDRGWSFEAAHRALLQTGPRTT